MPPRKPIKSLFDLSLLASRDLMMSTMKKIETSHPGEKFLSFDVPQCRVDVQSLQDYLKDLLPAKLYQLLLLDILQHRLLQTFSPETSICDDRIIYGTFIYQNVNLEKFVFSHFTIRNCDSASLRNELHILQNQRRIDFWVERIPMLTKLVEVDLEWLQNDDLILAFSKTCTQLKVMRLSRRVSSTTESVLRICKNLEVLDYIRFTDKEIDEIMTPLRNDNVKLKLRNLHLLTGNADLVNLALDICPDLQDLVVASFIDNFQGHEIMQSLTSRPLKLSRFYHSYYDNLSEMFNNFFQCKGIYITRLHIVFHFGMANPFEEMKVISETCNNLTALEITSSRMQEERAWNKTVPNRISFPKLKMLKITSYEQVNGLLALITLVDHCIRDSVNLKTFELTMYDINDEQQIVDALVNLFSINAGMQQLTRLRLFAYVERFTEVLLRIVFEKCINLTHLTLNKVSRDAEVYLEEVCNLVKFNNLDLTLHRNVH